MLIVSIAVFGGFETNIDRGSWSSNANSSFQKVTSQTWQGYNLASLLPYVVIAMVIVGIIMKSVF